MNVHPGVHEKNRNLHRPVHPGVHGFLLFRNPLCRNGLRNMYKRKERGLIKTSCPVPKPKKSKIMTPESRKKVRRNVRVKFLKKNTRARRRYRPKPGKPKYGNAAPGQRGAGAPNTRAYLSMHKCAGTTGHTEGGSCLQKGNKAPLLWQRRPGCTAEKRYEFSA